jgi:two-component system sensor histidine kinase KdpD
MQQHPARQTADSTRRRRQLAWLLTILGLPLLVAITLPFRSSIALTTELLLFLTLVLIVAAIGGMVVAAVAAWLRPCWSTGSSSSRTTR